MITDNQILSLINEIALHKCEKAYKSLFVEMHESLIDFANSFLNSTEDAEEVVSDFFIVIWKRRESLGEIKYPKLYFFAGVKNTALNRIKLNKRQHITTGTD